MAATTASDSSLTVVSPSSLPRFIALQSTSDSSGSYLTINVRQKDGLPYLTFTATEKTRWVAHEVVFNVDEEGVFVLRAPNGRFWRRDDSDYILADRDGLPSSPSSDPSLYFKAFSNASGFLVFQTVLGGVYLTRHRNDNLVDNSLKASATSSNADDASASLRYTTAKDFAVVLPRYIMLFGNNNTYVGNYLAKDVYWLKFEKETPDLSVAHEVVPLVNGNVAIVSLRLRQFWRPSPNWIWVDVRDASAALTNKDCHYDIIKLSDSVIAFKSVANDRLLKRYTEYWENCLCAIGTTIDDPTTHLRLHEAVLSRQIFNVKYLLALAEVTGDLTPLVIGSGSMANDGDNTTTLVVKVTYTREVTNTQIWTSSTTFSASITASFTAGIPEVASVEGSISLGAEFSFSTEWGTTRSQTLTFEASYEVNDVQPEQEATVTVQCTTAKCRIPFTYTSKDTRIDGVDQPAVENVDGIFEGVNALNILGVMTTKDPDGTQRTRQIIPVPLV